ncbi:hypothetical protein [Halorubrum sp. Ea8]|uniref:DUF7344 domain-containing protein n=1 Tax=Halorubrum sp. Ea8 TaxID=1383841 RepID=UPI000B9810E7|nr:hypothetical protein [Halorubrum sp. Ea8]OYR48368.1 hypothetical protein DJ74_10790 [Halorubrum sp. Ea8]
MIKGVEGSQINESAETGDGQRLTTTDVFDVLKNDRRRAVMRYLHEHGGSAELSDVAEHVAARENDTAVRQLTSQERKRVRIALYQCHLPRMDALGVVDFDNDRGTVALRDAASQFQVYLELDPEADRNAAASERTAFLLAVGIAAVVTAGALGLGVLSAVPPAGWTMVSVLALVGIAGRQWRA